MTEAFDPTNPLLASDLGGDFTHVMPRYADERPTHGDHTMAYLYETTGGVFTDIQKRTLRTLVDQDHIFELSEMHAVNPPTSHQTNQLMDQLRARDPEAFDEANRLRRIMTAIRSAKQEY